MPVDPTQAHGTAARVNEIDHVQPKSKGESSQAASNSPNPPRNGEAAQNMDQVEVSANSATGAAATQYVLAYHVDDQTNDVYFQVLDEKTGEVIRQVPSQEVLSSRAHVAEYLRSFAKTLDESAGKAKRK